MAKPDPVLPFGNASILSGISENFSFHASPESFIRTSILRYHEQHPGNVQNRTPVRAKILNRNTIIISAYKQIKQILEEDNEAVADPSYVATAPYTRLMEDFFPKPNLLLEDGCPHHQMRVRWDEAIQQLDGKNIHSIASKFVKNLEHDVPFDLYKSLKDLGWQIFLSQFLEMIENDKDYCSFIKLQEDLLRGQFSLFPINVNAWFWHSPRKRGIDARRELQTIIAQRVERQRPRWLPSESAAQNHVLMATSSLAVKGFASLLLAFFLNVYLFTPGDSAPGPPLDRGNASGVKLKSILLETLRLSPPIVGVMRRTTRDSCLESPDTNSPDILLPKGWDIWSYFLGANRDQTFGEDADLFRPSRYLGGEPAPEPIAFGLGRKKCLGASFVEQAALAVLNAFDEAGLSLEGTINAPGVRGWLGWQIATPEEWAKDMKQLPTQRPSKPVMVRVESTT